jgi:hypothetical protein
MATDDEAAVRDAAILMRVPAEAREAARLALIELEALENNPNADAQDALRAVQRVEAAINALITATEP